jgi:tetratricopeptide (TPR) repeat protein
MNSFVFLSILMAFVFFLGLKNGNTVGSIASRESKSNSASENFEQDIATAQSYAVYENRAFDNAKNGNYEQAVSEYKKALDVIQHMPGDKWPNLKKEDVDRMNQQTRIDAQIFSRYGLAEALEKIGQYDEALQNVEWLIQNQHVKGKEELLKRKLNGMKQSLLQKMQQ